MRTQHYSDVALTLDLNQVSGCHFNLPSYFVGEKVMADDEFTCDLFRFLQLLCEGHNNGEPPFEMRITKKKDSRPPVVFCCRFSELLADSDWQHHDHQRHHLYGGLPSPAAGTRPPAVSHIKRRVNGFYSLWLVNSLLFQFKESISDFYWYYSGKDVIDEPGKKNFSKAMTVAKQIFNTLTEYIQVKHR